MLIKRYESSPHGIYFWCQGCKASHGISIAPGRWTYNGNDESPTISPSVLSFYIHPATQERVTTCHLFVRDGKIEFLGDCQHTLAGQTLPMEHFPDHD